MQTSAVVKIKMTMMCSIESKRFFSTHINATTTATSSSTSPEAAKHIYCGHFVNGREKDDEEEEVIYWRLPCTFRTRLERAVSLLPQKRDWRRRRGEKKIESRNVLLLLVSSKTIGLTH